MEFNLEEDLVMKNFRLVLGTLLAVTLAGAGLTGCGEVDDGQPPAEDECTSDSDCDGDDVCWTGGEVNECVVNCTPPDNTNACKDFEVCVDANDLSQQKGCVDESRFDDGDTGIADDGGMGDAGMDGGMGDGGMDECETADDCPGEDNICVDGQCEMTQTPSVRFIQLKDVTLDVDPDAEADACEGSAASDPGSDVMAVRLRDSQGNHKGWANYVTNDNQGSSNTHTMYGAVLDGDAPTFNPDMDETCVDDFSTSSVVALGCDNGVLAVGFHNEDDEYVEIEQGDQITVYEYGEDNCGGTPVDKLNVKLCTTQSASMLQDTSPNQEGDYGACDTMSLGQGGGVVSVTADPLPDLGGGS